METIDMEEKDIDMKELAGARLLGYMDLKSEEWSGDWDNAIALFIGHANSPQMYVLRTENADYSYFSEWYLDKADTVLARDDRYKAIGEDIISVTYKQDLQVDGDRSWVVEIRTKTKVIRLGIDWGDSYYPSSLWEVL